MRMSEKVGEVAMALSKAQGAMRAAQKDRENPFFKSSYATLASVIDAIREPFSVNNLAFSQPTRVDEHGRVFATTIIIHGGSGEYISGEASANPVKNDPQGVGSLISYLKRYGLQALVGVASADEDDDGTAATNPERKPQEKPAKPTSAKEAALAAAHAPDPPRKPSIFDVNDSVMQKKVANLLRDRKVDERYWDEIGRKLHGRPSTEVYTVIADVTANA